MGQVLAMVISPAVNSDHPEHLSLFQQSPCSIELMNMHATPPKSDGYNPSCQSTFQNSTLASQSEVNSFPDNVALAGILGQWEMVYWREAG